MNIFTSRKRRAEQADQARLVEAQSNVNRLRMFLPAVAAGLDSEGIPYAQRAISILAAIAGWPKLGVFIYHIGDLESKVAKLTSEADGQDMDRAFALVPMRMLLKAYAQPITLEDANDMQTIICMLLVWWGFSIANEEPNHPVVRLMKHFGGHPFNSSSAEDIKMRFDQIQTRITPEAYKVWKQAEQAMKTFDNGL